MSSNTDLEFKPSFTAFGNDQWRKGGMTFSGLKETTQAINYMYGAGRQNIIPDANPTADFRSNNPSFKPVVSSIGLFQTNGLGQIASGTSGPGTLFSTNVSAKHPVASTDVQIGVVQSTPNKVNFVDYRSTDPVLVQNLRNNPISIYAQGDDVKNKEIPPFFADINPENYSNYVHNENVDISDETKQLYVDGSPNVSILGMAEQNPFLGLGHVKPNTDPQFTGKVYGGNNSAEAEGIANNLYNQVWSGDRVENFGTQEGHRCKNKALVPFAQGYNISEQINERKLSVQGPNAQSNLPWGPIKVTGNPQTQQGGIWQKGDNRWPTKSSTLGIQNTNTYVQKPLPPKKFVNPYKNGLPGTLISR